MDNLDNREIHEKSAYTVDNDRIAATDMLTRVVKQHLEKNDLDEYFTAHLHGSGFDGDWHVDTTPSEKQILATIDFHHMDENGYYDGWSTVNVYLTFTLDIIRTTYTASSYIRRKYLWDDYPAEAVYEAVSDIRQDLLQEVFDERKAWRAQSGLTYPAM